MTAELTLLSTVAFRGQEITGPRPRELLAGGCGVSGWSYSR
ncbi:hypothetical protein [Micromonospora citrea]|nr:hypothetical protein [Micromonospora citrea]